MSTGTPLDGNYDVTVNIYDVQVGGSVLWSETHVGLPVKKGVFSVLLGKVVPFNSVTPEIDFNVPYWLGISVNAGTELTPRIDFASVGTAFTAKNIEDGVVTESKIVDGSVTGAKIPAGQVVKSLNGQTDHITLPTIPAPITCNWSGWRVSDGGVPNPDLSYECCEQTSVFQMYCNGSIVTQVNALNVCFKWCSSY